MHLPFHSDAESSHEMICAAESAVSLRKAIELYTEMGRLGMAARHIKVTNQLHSTGALGPMHGQRLHCTTCCTTCRQWPATASDQSPVEW